MAKGRSRLARLTGRVVTRQRTFLLGGVPARAFLLGSGLELTYDVGQSGVLTPRPPLPRVGAHMSVAGGVRFAIERAALHGCEALQIFTRNPNQWHSRPLDAEDVRAFRRRRDETGITPAVSHASYLINLAAVGGPLRSQSLDALGDELDRAHQLGLDAVVLHPGACTSGTEPDALALVASGLDAVLAPRRRRRVRVLLEHTAGQGRALGHRFEQLAAVIGAARHSDRLGVCLDTCHLVAAGYDIVSEAGYGTTFADFDRIVGWSRLQVVHANDSKKPCGSRVDRHEHIGHGCLGLGTFARLLGDRRFAGLPFLIETAKTVRPGRPDAVALDPLDEKNLRTLRRLRDLASTGPREPADPIERATDRRRRTRR